MRAIKARRTSIPELARNVGCTRATLHNYRLGKNTTIEALLLFEIADALNVSTRWLLTGDGDMDRANEPREREKLENIRKILEERAP